MKLLKSVCEVCGAPLQYMSVIRLHCGVKMPDGSPARFDICVNGHEVNIRPYADPVEDYIYEDKLDEEIRKAKERLRNLEALKQ